MKIARSIRMRQKRRWRPTLGAIVRRTIRKQMPSIIRNVLANNALFRSLLARGSE
jgi:hypothetical protein